MTALTVTLAPEVRRGPARWLRDAVAILRWQLTSIRLVLPVLVVVQMLLAAGLSVGIGLFYQEPPTTTVLYLATGAAVITLIVVGIIAGPQIIAEEKQAGSYDFTWSLPVPRSAATAAWVVVNAIVAIPAMVAALVIAGWRFDLDYALSWQVVPATGLVLVSATLIGYAFAHVIGNTNVTQLLTQVLAFGIIGFTPISYPAENLPGWLAAIHEALPFVHMGAVVRASLTVGLVDDVAVSYVVLATWTLAAVGVTAWALGRRT